MKLQVLVVDLDLSPRSRKIFWSAAATTAFLLIGVGGVYAAWPDPPYNAGDTLTAESLNANFTELDRRVALAAPVGTILAYGAGIDKNPGEGTEAPLHPPPDGWLLCNGSALNILDPKYAALNAAIGTTFGGN